MAVIFTNRSQVITECADALFGDAELIKQHIVDLAYGDPGGLGFTNADEDINAEAKQMAREVIEQLITKLKRLPFMTEGGS
jgi:hypothetical protein